MLLPSDPIDWELVDISTKHAACVCGLGRLLLPSRHRMFRPGSVLSMYVEADCEAHFIPHGGGIPASLMELYWQESNGSKKLRFATDPLRAEGEVIVDAEAMHAHSYTINGVKGYLLSATVDEINVPLGMVVNTLEGGGMNIIPDAAMRLHVPAVDDPLPDRCACRTAWSR
ncbi:MAG TPA: hypothetical protein VLA88_02145 [Candidatus Saccharimonadales bacterium]|nr:hypothetical protein [Candidatus Saccharimonadales bacterium]